MAEDVNTRRINLGAWSRERIRANEYTALFLQLDMYEILEPAIRYAEGGFPVGLISSVEWQRRQTMLERMHGGGFFLSGRNRAPSPGDTWKNVPMARLLKVSCCS